MDIDTPEVVAEVIDTPDAIETPAPTLRETLEATRDEIAAREERERDEHGRFKPKAAAEPMKAVAPLPEAIAEPIVAEPAPIEPAPASWSADAKAKWAEVPPEVRGEFAKRETEVRQMAGRMDSERQFGRAMTEVVRPYEAIMRANNTHPAEVVQRMMNTEYTMATGTPEAKARVLAMAAKQYGIDLDLAYQFKDEAAPSAPAMAQAPPVDVNAQIEAVIAQRELKREVEAFHADPKNEHYEIVRNVMAALMDAGEATSLQAAYDMAVFARPDLRSTQLAAEKAKWEAQQAASQRTAQAKRAAVSLPGSSGSPRPTGTPQTSLRSELQTGLREMLASA